MIILIFIILHWFLAGFFQTFFLHRYAAHKMFTTSKFNERVFYFLTFIFQGSSFLTPRAYALMHREHHAYSDTEKDPHSPHFVGDMLQMIRASAKGYLSYEQLRKKPEKQLAGNIPFWLTIDRIGSSIYTRLAFAAAYIAFYIVFANHWWLYLFLPLTLFMGIIQGSMVNWFGHKYGYTNFDNDDHSKNTTPIGFIFLGELFQNNHHRHPNRANFGIRWFEFDPVYQVMRLFNYTGIIKIRKAV